MLQKELQNILAGGQEDKMVTQTEFSRAVEGLYRAIDHSFGGNPDEGSIIKNNLAAGLKSGTPYLEEVHVERVGEQQYEGTVKIDDPGSEEPITIKFRYVLPLTPSELDSYVEASGAQTIQEKGALLEKITEFTVMRESGEPIEGSTRDSLVDYLRESVPYAIALLDHQVGTGGQDKGTFRIPRTEIVE